VAHEAEITYYEKLIHLKKNLTKELRANLNKVCSFAIKLIVHPRWKIVFFVHQLVEMN